MSYSKSFCLQLPANNYWSYIEREKTKLPKIDYYDNNHQKILPANNYWSYIEREKTKLPKIDYYDNNHQKIGWVRMVHSSYDTN